MMQKLSSNEDFFYNTTVMKYLRYTLKRHNETRLNWYSPQSPNRPVSFFLSLPGAPNG